MDTVEKITRTCLYEGYLLWPYRRSALKNGQRWTFGGVFPPAPATELGEPDSMRTEVLLEAGPRTTVAVRVRFLHLVDRRVLRETPGGAEPVDELTVGDELYLSWQEATEREVVLPAAHLGDSPGRPPEEHAFVIPAGGDEEPVTDAAGHRVGTVVRSWQRLTGVVETSAELPAEGVLRLRVGIRNTTAAPVPPCSGTPLPDGCGTGTTGRTREAMSAYAFLSTHTVLHAEHGRFVSLADPPDGLGDAAADCRNTGTWPVLVDEAEGDAAEAAGRDPQRSRTMLSSPVTLYDFPAVAPESPGDLFDGTEIDQLLVLSVLSMTEREQAEARACDPRAREILDRCAALTPRELMALHGRTERA